MQRISKAELAERLDAALGEPVGIAGLNILLYGWKKYRKYGAKYCDALKHRDWMYYVEVVDFSEYAQVDLLSQICDKNDRIGKREQNPFCGGESLRMCEKSSKFAL